MNVSNEVKELRLLFEVSRLFDGLHEVGERAGEVLALMARYTGLARGSLTLLEADGRGLSVYSAKSSRLEELVRGRARPGEGLGGLIIESGRPMAMPRAEGRAFFLDRKRDLNKDRVSLLGVPIKAGDRTIGALSADRLFADSISLDEDLRLLKVLAALLAQAAGARQQLREEAAARPPPGAGLTEALEALEKRLIHQALRDHRGNMGRAAQALGISERVMGLRMKKFNFDYREFRPGHSPGLQIGVSGVK